MTQTATPFLMFEGKCEEAIGFYVSLLDQSGIRQIERWAEAEPGPTGGVKRADFTLCGRDYIAIDSPSVHDFSFTPSISIFVDCADEANIDMLFEKFSGGGKVLMPLQDWGFSKKFAWVEDRYGVSWQLNLPFGN